MHTIGKAKRVVFYVGESDKWGNKPLYLAILERLKAEDCAGATVTRALAGFGAHSRIQTASVVALSNDLPLIIEWVDNQAKVERLMPHLLEMVTEGLITVEDVNVVFYSHRELRHLSAFVPVQDIANRDLRAVRSDTPLVEIVERLIDKTEQALPVVDAEGRVVGIITAGDLLSRLDLLIPSIHKHMTENELESELQRLRNRDLVARDIMTADPVTVTMDTTIPAVVETMLERDIKRMPVVDEQGIMIGIVSRGDVLRAFAQPLFSELPRPNHHAGQHACVGEVMFTAVGAVRRDASLAEIVDLLVSSRQRRVVVVDEEDQVVGIITDGDLLKRAQAPERSGIIQSLMRRMPAGREEDYHLSQRTAEQVMTSPVITVRPDTSLLEALQLMLDNDIMRIPVVDPAGRLVGLVGRRGILQAMGSVGDQVQ